MKAGSTSVPLICLTAVYDAWNKMVSLSAGATPVGKYQYDGRGFRIVKETYASGVLSEARDFYFTANWQDIEEDVSGSTVGQYVWGIRYFDELICRDDPTPQRLYACQDANFNLTGISDFSGTIAERYLFDPYGNRTIMNPSWAVIAPSAYSWIIGDQGLRQDDKSGFVICLTRVLIPTLGRFLERDKVGYLDDTSLYQYEQSSPLGMSDRLGMAGLQINPYYTGAVVAGWAVAGILDWATHGSGYTLHEFGPKTCPPGQTRYLASDTRTYDYADLLTIVTVFGMPFPEWQTQVFTNLEIKIWACCPCQKTVQPGGQAYPAKTAPPVTKRSKTWLGEGVSTTITTTHLGKSITNVCV